MELDRRSLIKGMLASGALLALGLPSWAFPDQFPRRRRPCSLILTGSCADEAFARGAQAACASMGLDGFRTLYLKDRLLSGTDEIGHLLVHASGGRVIAVMDDASSIVFLELARAAGVRMLSMGSHACSTERACEIRHDFASTSQHCSAGGLLASLLIHGESTFSIMETYLHDTSQQHAPTAWPWPGFCSYRSVEPGPMQLHCSGLSLSEACQLLALDAATTWSHLDSARTDRGSMPVPLNHWVESAGYAVTGSALGMDPIIESCSQRAFVRWATQSQGVVPHQRFMSFVMDL